MKDDKGFEETTATESEAERNRRYCLSKHCLLISKGDLFGVAPLIPCIERMKYMDKPNIEAWRNEHQMLLSCRQALTNDYAISKAYHGRNLITFLDDIINKFGFDRVSAVLAHTIRHAEWDGRYYSSVKEWARNHEPISQAPVQRENDNEFYDLCINEHPVILNDAARMLMTRQQEIQHPQRKELER